MRSRLFILLTSRRKQKVNRFATRIQEKRKRSEVRAKRISGRMSNRLNLSDIASYYGLILFIANI